MSKTLENSSKTERCEKRDFAMIWAKLTAGYPHTPTTAGTMIRYYERLLRFPAPQIAQAVDVATEQCEQFPTIARLLKIIGQLKESQKKPTPKYLEGPRPSAEEMAKAHEQIQALIDGTATGTRFPEHLDIGARKALLKQQAQKLAAEEH